MRSGRRRWRGVLGAGLVGFLVTVPWAASAGEDEAIIAVEPSYAILNRADGVAHGIGVSASAWLGTDSSFWLAASTGTSGHFGREQPLNFELLGGVVYAFDVFTAIPFAEAYGGVIIGEGGPQPTARFGLGADYLVMRTVSLGLVARYRPIAHPLGNALITAQIRLAVRLEY